LDVRRFKRFAELLLALRDDISFIHLYIDSSALDKDCSLSNTRQRLELDLKEKAYADKILQLNVCSKIMVDHMFGLSLRRKIDIYRQADLGIYPFGSGLCPIACLTNTPILEYRPGVDVGDENKRAFDNRLKYRKINWTVWQQDYPNLVFLDKKSGLTKENSHHYWFDVVSLARYVADKMVS